MFYELIRNGESRHHAVTRPAICRTWVGCKEKRDQCIPRNIQQSGGQPKMLHPNELIEHGFIRCKLMRLN